MNKEELSVLARAVTRIFQNWGIEPRAACAILALESRDYVRWLDGNVQSVPAAARDRMSLVLHIHTCLRVTFSDRTRGYAWMGRPNAVFEGRSPTDLISSGNLADLQRLARYLKAEMQA